MPLSLACLLKSRSSNNFYKCETSSLDALFADTNETKCFPSWSHSFGAKMERIMSSTDFFPLTPAF